MSAAPPRRTSRGFAVAMAAFLGVLGVLAVGAGVAVARPAPPAGFPVLAAGQLPVYCSEGNAQETGVYFDIGTGQWLNAPNCLGRWGNLDASPSQTVRAGTAVTVTAIPTGGSNSGTYAPQTHSISWDLQGIKPVKGCGSADLTCRFVPAARATRSWQWVQVHVSMPRTFFIDSPGSNCAGQHLCAGVTTNAWTWIGVKPNFCLAKASDRVLIGSSCSDAPKYSKEDKDYAKEMRRHYADLSLYYLSLATAGGAYSTYAAATGVGAGPAAVGGVLTAGFTGLALNAQWWQEQYARIQEDPPDRRWRTIARPPATHPSKLALPRGLSRAQKRQIVAFVGSQARSAALAKCLATAIDRGTTALPVNPKIAAKQYRAGAACARENAKRSAAAPRLAAPVVALLRPYDAQFLALVAKAPHGAAFRRVIAKSFTALGQSIEVPAGRLAALERAALRSTTVPTVAPSAAIEQAAAEAARQAAAMRASAAVLSAAAAGRS